MVLPPLGKALLDTLGLVVHQVKPFSLRPSVV